MKLSTDHKNIIAGALGTQVARGEISINTAMSIMKGLREETGNERDILDEIHQAINEYKIANHKSPKYLIIDNNSYFLLRNVAQIYWSGLVEADENRPERCMGLIVARVNSQRRIVEFAS